MEAATDRPSEPGTYRDAGAAHGVLLRQPASAAARTIYLGELHAGAVALKLASERPPAGLILQSAFTSIRDMARLHGACPSLPPLHWEAWLVSR